MMESNEFKGKPECIDNDGHVWRLFECCSDPYDENQYKEYCIYCGVRYRLGMDRFDLLSVENYAPADEQSSIYVLRRALNIENKALSDDDRAAYDWAVSVATDVENEYEDITECVGYSDPSDLVDVLGFIRRIMLFFQAAKALGPSASVQGSTLDSVYFHIPDMGEPEVLDRIGDKYKIRWVSNHRYCLVLTAGDAETSSASF